MSSAESRDLPTEQDSPSGGAVVTPADSRRWFQTLRTQMESRFAGPAAILEQLLLPVLCGEHVLVSAPRGSGVWQLASGLGDMLGLPTGRLRCSTDLAVHDLEPGGVAGDPFQQSLLVADDFDQLAPKVRNVLHRAMGDRVVARGGTTVEVPDPFVVWATTAPPVEGAGDGTEVVDALHDDRFLLQVAWTYPRYQDEFRLVHTVRAGRPPAMAPVISKGELDGWRALAARTEAPPPVVHYAVRLVRATRVHSGENPDFIYEWVQRGAGPRAATSLILAARARGTLHGRNLVSADDIQALAAPVLRHRILTNRNARANGIDADRVIARLLAEIPVRVAGDEAIPTSSTGFTCHDWEPLDS